MIRRLVLALMALSFASAAFAQVPRPGYGAGFRSGFQFIGGVGGFPTPGAVVDYDFRGDRYSGPALAVSRASPAYIDDNAGNWTLVAANTLRRSDKGALIEGAQTNLVLYSGDLSNTAWTKAGAAATATQAGIEGAANAASLLTATVANGQATQAITSASSLRTTSVFLRRVSGTGAVQITQDNTNWTSCAVTSAWSRCQISATLANPVVGVRLAIAGDAVAVDIVQNETWASGVTTVGGASSPIRTTGAAVTRAADVVAAPNPIGAAIPITVAAVFRPGLPLSGTATIVRPGSGPVSGYRVVQNAQSGVIVAGETSGAGTTNNVSVVPGVRAAVAAGGDATDQGMSTNGSAVATAGALTMGHNAAMGIGANLDPSGFLFGYIERLAIWPTRLTNGQLQQYSTLATWGG